MILEQRKKLGLTQKELADKIGVKQNTISMWESGTITPKSKDLKKIANVLKITVEEILDCFEK